MSHAQTDVIQRMETLAFLLGRVRYPMGSERALQDAIAETFRRNHLVGEREKRLDADDRPDFFVPLPLPSPLRGDAPPPHAGEGKATVGIVVEVKIDGGRRAIYGQCERYCRHPEVAGLVLATAKAGALPAVIAGKPARIVDLGRAWL